MKQNHGGGHSGMLIDMSGHRAPPHAEKKFRFRVVNMLTTFSTVFCFFSFIIHIVMMEKC